MQPSPDNGYISNNHHKTEQIAHIKWEPKTHIEGEDEGENQYYSDKITCQKLHTNIQKTSSRTESLFLKHSASSLLSVLPPLIHSCQKQKGAQIKKNRREQTKKFIEFQFGIFWCNFRIITQWCHWEKANCLFVRSKNVFGIKPVTITIVVTDI